MSPTRVRTASTCTNSNANIDQIPDSYVAQAAAQSLAGQTLRWNALTAADPESHGEPQYRAPATQSTILAGQLVRPYPQYNN